MHRRRVKIPELLVKFEIDPVALEACMPIRPSLSVLPLAAASLGSDVLSQPVTSNNHASHSSRWMFQ